MQRHDSLWVLICLLLVFVVLAISSGPALAQQGGNNNNQGGNNNNHGGNNNPGAGAAPELDPGIAVTGVALLAMGMLILIDRRRAMGPHTSA
jgi:hypothetical protein